MRIVNSHYVPLSEPYPIIYCKGEIGMQVGTLIVIEDNYGDDPSVVQSSISDKPYFRYPYGIRSHSHPVVVYGNKERAIPIDAAQPNDWSEGVVWDKVELRDVVTLCYSNVEAIDEDRLTMLVSTERFQDVFNNTTVFKLGNTINQLKKLGLHFAFNGFNSNGIGELMLLKGGVKPEVNCLISNHLSGLPYLFVAVRWGEIDGMEKKIREQVDDYLRVISPVKIRIKFNFREEEVKSIAERLNAIYYQK